MEMKGGLSRRSIIWVILGHGGGSRMKFYLTTIIPGGYTLLQQDMFKYSHFFPQIQPFRTDGVLPLPDYKKTISCTPLLSKKLSNLLPLILFLDISLLELIPLS